MGPKDICRKGKSCGAACIQLLKRCIIDLGDSIRSSLLQLRDKLIDNLIVGLERLQRNIENYDIKRFSNKWDKEMESKSSKVDKYGSKSFEWREHTKQGVFGGKGVYGSVIINGDTVVKRGTLSIDEPRIMDKAHKVGAAPRVIASEILRSEEPGVKYVRGRMAMERVSGLPLVSMESKNQVIREEAANSYWALRKKLHEGGIAHNDLHLGNAFYDPKTKTSKAIDFGLSSTSLKDVLKEAIAPLYTLRDMRRSGMSMLSLLLDRSVDNIGIGPPTGFSPNRGEMISNLGKIHDNFPKVRRFLMSNGVSSGDINDLDFRYVEGNIIKQAISMLYDGVG